jgi:hypothetical protein
MVKLSISIRIRLTKAVFRIFKRLMLHNFIMISYCSNFEQKQYVKDEKYQNLFIAFVAQSFKVTEVKGS